MTETLCILSKPALEIACVCFDQKPCDIRIDDGGQLVCRYGSNEGVIEGVAKVICPLEIASEQIKWDIFLSQEANTKEAAKKSTKHK
jgi:hypothetical protein